ncbi:MAG: filamentous hemagglutinin N-terminal domain-containing protein, partial [Gammaproteobacteria bacterium]
MDKNKRNRSGRAPTRHRRDTEPRFAFRLLPWLIRSVCLLPAGAAFASPQGGAVIAGQGTIGQPDGSTTVIRQQSNSLAIDWRSFDLAAGDRVRFEQPSSSAAVLNRVLSQRPSQILGSIQANGRVFLINPAGIIFGAGARVNVGSLVASSLGMSTSDFMAGNYRFQSPAGQDGGLVVNRGVIQAATGGSVSLIGGAVANQGAIVADYGYVNLGAGRQAVLDFGGDGLMGFQVSGKVLSNAAGVKSAVSNSGTITAGEVVLSGQAAADVFTQAVNNQGVVRAGRIDDSGGTIRLAAAGAGAVNTGTLDASATAAGQHGGSVVMVGPEVSQDGVVRADAANGDAGTVTVQAADQAVLGGDSLTSARSVSGGTGGTVQVLGAKVGLFDQASIDVSGAQGGGTALVGGNARGQGPLPNASYAFMSSGASIDANANSTGHGGHVVIWSNDATRAYGRIAARGGDAGGDGGLIETSGHYLDVSGLRADAGAPQGMAGNWLLDPYDVEIVSSGGTAATKVTGTTATWTASTSPTQINASDIVTELEAGTNVTIQTNGATPAGTDAGTITVGAAIAPTMSTSAATLSLDAASDITIQTGAAITASGANPLNVTLSSAGGAITTSSAITTNNGTLTMNGGGAVTIAANLDAGTGTVGIDTGGTGSITGAGTITAANLNLQTVSGTGAVGSSSAALKLSAGSGVATTVSVGTGSNAASASYLEQTSGNLVLGASNVSGVLTATSDSGAITQSGVLKVGGLTTLTANDATNGSIDVSTQANAFGGAVSLNAAHDGKVTNAGNLLLGASNVGGALTATSNTGTITQNGVLTVGGATTLTANDATNGSIDVSTHSNAFTGAVSMNTSHGAKVKNAGNLLLGTSNVTGALTATSNT